jgi:hypothetical protein
MGIMTSTAMERLQEIDEPHINNNVDDPFHIVVNLFPLQHNKISPTSFSKPSFPPTATPDAATNLRPTS